MKRLVLILLVAALLPVPAASAAEVSQGKCVRYETEKGLILLEEYDVTFTPDTPYGRPTGVQSRFDIRSAKIGLHPEPGDILRIAYEIQGDRKVALKVMNVSKQDLHGK